ncbi:hypothetical protein FA09DRAFT_328862 [Tilletiopsis washingtonensis]|jgi:hypothetical protein|uniref:Uncharacterized protein n=1 Tax=Tilletiopsis washingtonensis TaxID=58919 RepID=A0A316ZD72_9BASI|nr:hypothetical protein FA09DRAFT_328862 [Tilletiopsis washingtonensis]PWN99469.1 hypothetical protein FA09DRAFT_328862 [Tilletiopsis washingtonensis]
MPLAAQRQRQAPSATAGPSSRAPKSTAGAAPSSYEDDDDASSSDDSGDEAAALEMDGQELWAQNYCATCDCLIPPGAGVSASPASPQPADAQPEAGPSRLSDASGLKSRTGTIKARPPSADGKAAANSGGGALKRTHSTGRLHAVGGTGAGMGQHKRTGSAAGRLNALSDLKPTTKLHDDAPAPKGKGSDSTRSPALSRRSSLVSTRSGGSGGAHGGASGPSSPSASTSALPRTKKSGLLGGLTPAALRQEEEEARSAKVAPALYCSERCRLIDQQRSAGLGELANYLSQPTAPPVAWANSGWGSAAMTPGGTTAWPRRVPSMTSMPAAIAGYAGVVRTPESECMCPECLDRSSSASGTMPSGASDTTESSASLGYAYAAGRQKQRTTSGRIVTPHGLVPHHSDGYFPVVPPAGTRRASNRDSPRTRTTSLRPALNATSTDGSTQSSESNRSTSEPGAASETLDRSASIRTRSSTMSEDTRGILTTGTVTPAATVRGSSSSNSPRAEAMRRNGSESRSASYASSRPFGSTMSVSASTAASPLRLLRRGDHHAEAMTNVSAEQAHSPHGGPHGMLSSSLASNSGFTELASSATTMGTALDGSSLHHRRAKHNRALPDFGSERNSSAITVKETARRDSEAPLDSVAHLERLSSSYNPGASAVGSLKQAAAGKRQSIAGPPSRLDSERPEHHRGGSDGSQQRPAWNASAPRRISFAGSNGSGNSSSGWLRSLTSAWATIRGVSSDAVADDAGIDTRDDTSSLRGADKGFTSRQRGEAVARDTRPPSSASSRRGSAGSSARGGLLSPAVGSLTALSTLDAQSRGEEPTPTQSLVTRPNSLRGMIPAYARGDSGEIVHGDESDTNAVAGASSPQFKRSGSRAAAQSRSPKGVRNRSSDEPERRRRRSDRERERAIRHQRSKDVTVLPPLLGPSDRSFSSTNLANGRPRSTRTQSTASSGYGRSRAGSNGQASQLQVGSAGSAHSFSRPTTRSPGGDAHSYSNPPSAGTSPRRAGLGWGAMTTITSPVEAAAPPPHGLQHGYSSSIALGHAAALSARGVHHPANLHHGAHHAQFAPSGATHQHRPHAVRAVHHHRGGGALQVGHIGLLGAHPHGHAPVYGRHATTPARSSTPRVPEDGGEMSGAALRGADEAGSTHEVPPSRPRSAMSQHRASTAMGVQRPRSVVAMRALGGGMQPLASTNTLASSGLAPLSPGMPPVTINPEVGAPPLGAGARTWSYEALPGVKTYPVLQLPDRETHDRYDDGWGLGDGGLEEMMTGRKLPRPAPPPSSTGAVAGHAPEGSSGTLPRMPKRKTLFYFDA